ncbi:MAG: acyl-CoA dehydrogenase family protein [Ilumatobacteraceae bacterium]|jgi:alkylation response protein AidB-like acyl-CoA dehydrogenase|nr:acyl-CoA dehydrogenase family protein [Ilumatobacteraceae bacterium]
MSTPTREQVRAEIAEWLADAWDPDIGLAEWRERLVASGWAVPSWSREWYGRGLPAWADTIVSEQLRAVGAVGTPLGAGMSLAAPTLYTHASDELKHQFLRPTLTGELTWCQLFSEPSAGSDLAGMKATAVLDGDEWVVNGQKVWNTSAHHADLGMLVVRTNWDVPKHHGISYFVLPMHQTGVEVRPILQMNQHASFNEVFLTDARIPTANLVGQLDDGWRVARTTLLHERAFATMRRPKFGQPGTYVGHTVAEAQAEADEHFRTYVWYPQRAGRADLVIERARTLGVADDPIVRQAITDLVLFVRINEWTASRARAARALGRPPGPEGSLGKLAASEVARRSNVVHSLIGGAGGMITDAGHPHDATIAEVLISTPAQSIAGGTDEIQRNILGESVLGLPREPTGDTDRPFRDVVRGI